MSNNFIMGCDDRDEPVWGGWNEDDVMIASSDIGDDDISRACWVNILLNTASLVDLPRLDRLATWIGHDTVNENDTGHMGTSRGKGGKIDRVQALCDEGDDGTGTCVCCGDVLFAGVLS